MALIDSHWHADAFIDDGTVQAVLDRCKEAGVTRTVAIGGSAAANERAVRLAEANPGFVAATVGWDREYASQDCDDHEVVRWLGHRGVVAIGETGLDYHYEAHTANEQKELFGRMIRISLESRLPMVIHTREADEDTESMLREHAAQWTGDVGRVGVVHCFTGTTAFAKRLLDLGYHIGISGIVTFKNAGTLRDVARFLPADRILIETDAPYLAPVPHRGQRNEPAFVMHVAEAVAQVRGTTPAEIGEQCARNTNRLFGLL